MIVSSLNIQVELSITNMYIFGIKNVVFGDRKRSFAQKIASLVTSIPSLNIILLPNMIQQWDWSQILTP